MLPCRTLNVVCINIGSQSLGSSGILPLWDGTCLTAMCYNVKCGRSVLKSVEGKPKNWGVLEPYGGFVAYTLKICPFPACYPAEFVAPDQMVPALRRFAQKVTLVSRLSRSLKVIGTKQIDRLPITYYYRSRATMDLSRIVSTTNGDFCLKLQTFPPLVHLTPH